MVTNKRQTTHKGKCMKKFLAILPLAAVTLAVGCKSTNMSKVSSPVATVIEAPLVADITVGQDIKGESSATVILGLFTIGADSKFADNVNYNVAQSSGMTLPFLGDAIASNVKAAAAYKACESGNAEILVAPRYTLEVEDYFVFKTITATVNAKKGTLVNIKNK